jgi:hypothetical protein
MNSGSASSNIFTDYIEVRAHSRATEVPKRVEEAILNIFQEDLKEHVKVKRDVAEGHSDNPIVVIKGVLKNKRRCLEELNYLVSSLDENDLSYIRHTMTRRFDDCRFYLRIDKQEAYLGNIHLAQVTDMISVEIRLRQYPRCEPDSAMEWLFEHLNK